MSNPKHLRPGLACNPMTVFWTQHRAGFGNTIEDSTSGRDTSLEIR